MPKLRIAIWGATGHVGQALLHTAIARGHTVTGYVRDIQKAAGLLPAGSYAPFSAFPFAAPPWPWEAAATTGETGTVQQGMPSQAAIISSNGKDLPDFDLLVNAIAAEPVADSALFETLERWDWLLIDYAKAHPACCCASISSGAVYGEGFEEPATAGTAFTLQPNQVPPGRRYGLIKLLCEQRHRAFTELSLVDLRLFAFFTRYMDFSQPFFMSDVVRAVQAGHPLVTQPTDFARDFIHPADILQLLLLCVDNHRNACFDLYSTAPIKKSEILELFARRYGLQVQSGGAWTSLTGAKARYYSEDRAAAALGYAPRYSAWQVLEGEMDAILNKMG